MSRLRRPVSVLTDDLRDWRDSFRPFCSVVLTGVIFTASLAAQDVSFEQQVAPVLESRCWGCHSADTQESGLRLDTRAGMLRGGDSGLAAVVPGDVKKSYLIDAVRHLDPNVEMPPDEDPLEADQIAVLERWIQQGAVWPGQMAAVAEEEKKNEEDSEMVDESQKDKEDEEMTDTNQAQNDDQIEEPKE